jgi:hypothetical protein
MTDKREKNPQNPVVVVAKKQVPRFQRAGKWIKAHKREVFLTLETMGALAVQYLFFKRRLMDLERKFAKKSVGLTKSTTALLAAGEKTTTAAVEKLDIAREMQVKQLGLQQKMAERLMSVEKALASPEFKKFLKEKHGLSNIRRVGGKKK